MVPFGNLGAAFGKAKCVRLNLRISLSLLSKLDTRGTLRDPVNGYEDSALCVTAGENFLITGVFGPVSDPDDIVPGALERCANTATGARIQEDLHEGVSVKNGSTRSCPTSLLAYTRQARMSSGSSQS